jgi:hypothetical protein
MASGLNSQREAARVMSEKTTVTSPSGGGLASSRHPLPRWWLPELEAELLVLVVFVDWVLEADLEFV